MGTTWPVGVLGTYDGMYVGMYADCCSVGAHSRADLDPHACADVDSFVLADLYTHACAHLPWRYC